MARLFRDGRKVNMGGRGGPRDECCWDRMYIRCCGNGCLWFRPYGGSLSKSAKVTKALLPHHSVPRLGSACLNEGIAPWAAAKGHPWPSAANPASMPGCPLRNAFVQPAWLMGRRDQRPPRGGLIADLVLGGFAFLLRERACSRRRSDSRPGALAVRRSNCGSEPARDDGCQYNLVVTGLPLSRASSLPQ
ncbi:Threonine synthase (EC 4.2.3.1) [Pseudomonas sp. FG-3G]|nr:Threonine synthase (EC 4.2.3.1) [Pseudomonas sp. FG-3G]